MDLVSKLLVHDPNDRLGANNTIGLLKQHPFFDGINWTDLWEQPAPKLHPYTPSAAQPTLPTASPILKLETEAGNGYESMKPSGGSLDMEDPVQAMGIHGSDVSSNSDSNNGNIFSNHNEDAGILFRGVNGTTPSSNTTEDLLITPATSSNGDVYRSSPNNRDDGPVAASEHGSPNANKTPSGRNPVLRWLSKMSKGSKGKKGKKAAAYAVKEREHALDVGVEHNEKHV